MLKRIRWYIWVVFLVLMVYIGISIYFMEHFFLGTTVNGKKAELLTTEEVNGQILTEAGRFRLTVQGRNGVKEELSPEELGVRYGAPDETARFKRQQNGFLWPRMLFKKDSFFIEPETSVDEEALRETVSSLSSLLKGEAPKDAWVELNENGYELHKEEQGARIQEEVFLSALLENAKALRPSLDLEEADCYEKPLVTVDSPELQEQTEALDHWLSAEITYVFGPRTEVVDKSAISSFLSLEDGEAELKEEAVRAYVQELASRYDTYKTPRPFHSTLRGTITVKGGNYGWQIDQESESRALYEAIESGEQMTKEPAYLHTGRAWSENSDIGDSYIEVDLSAQHMWLYKNGELVIDTDVVTGNMSRSFGTPAMVASIQYKQRDAVLRGVGYASPVKYWMPFYGNYGIHDANWRDRFGGDVYLTNGSHGCVNTPPSAMKVVFEHAEKGMPVILFY